MSLKAFAVGLAGLMGFSAAAWACATYSAAEIAQAVQNSPSANAAMQSTSCMWGGAAKAESGGDTCASNGNNFGVLQLNSGNLPAGMSGQDYLNLGLQEQVDIWAAQTGGNFGTGYQQLANNTAIGGTTVTPGMLGACYQFGPAICKNDVAFMQANSGQCPTPGNGGININNVKKSQQSTANLDGNGQSICSWGKVINQKIASNAKACKDCKPSQDGAVPSPSPSNKDIEVPGLEI
jgi:hypothetical protein